jgi:2'-hydroxyisoflavone reductase
MKILILGGTKFLGRALVDAARAAGHTVTLFNRGQTNPDLYPDVEKLRGDRDGGLAVLGGRKWDVAIDTCGYFPRLVGDSARALAGSVDHYTFISSISVYAEEANTTPNADETFPVSTIEDETVEDIGEGRYGALKALCEQAAEAAMPGRVLNIRPGLIVGPHDPTDRFSYWPVQVSRGGEILTPAADSPVQVIDVRDLAGWTLRMAEARRTGVFNATGPDNRLNFEPFINQCRAVVGNGAGQAVMVSDAFLLEHEVAPWANLPMWLPLEKAGLTQINIDKALAAGLTFRPIEETIRDTLAWFAQDRAEEQDLRGPVITPEREAELIAAWKAAQN